jgi:hypothetical protein
MFSANTTQVSTAANYIEDVFSTWLYASINGDNQIINNIDLSTKSGLVWIKSRSTANNHYLIDTVRGSSVGNTNAINSNTTVAQTTGPYLDWLQFNNNGFTAKAVAGGGELGTNTYYGNMVSWTFRKQPKFFDIVTYTGTGANRTIAHNLGSVPGCIMVKRTDAAADWQVYHRSLANTQYMVLNTTAAVATGATRWNSTTPTSTVFSVGTDTTVNASGGTYVAYIFAHNAGGFGNTGADNVISCGSFTTDGSGNATVTLGYEPQWVLIKRTNSVADWRILDTMRPWSETSTTVLVPNSASAESSISNGNTKPKATGFTTSGDFGVSSTCIYIAIRRGPMKTPTVGTSVYTSASRTGTASVMPRWVAGFPVDWAIRQSSVTAGGGDWQAGDRLRGEVQVKPNLTEAETAAALLYNFAGMTGYSTLGAAGSDSGDRSWMFRRAPGFFDVVCYTGTGANTTQTHNLAAVPELMIVKKRSATDAWQVYSSALANTQYVVLNTTAAVATGATRWNSTTPTSTVFSLGTATEVNASSATYVAYLFATVAGVSKVGSYTGTAALQTVNCGFTSGARFVLIKRTDSTGDWYVWDSARGITAGNDPYLLLNSTAAEVTGTNYVDTDATGFKVTAAAPAALNAPGGAYIFLAIA